MWATIPVVQVRGEEEEEEEEEKEEKEEEEGHASTLSSPSRALRLLSFGMDLVS